MWGGAGPPSRFSRGGCGGEPTGQTARSDRSYVKKYKTYVFFPMVGKSLREVRAGLRSTNWLVPSLLTPQIEVKPRSENKSFFQNFKMVQNMYPYGRGFPGRWACAARRSHKPVERVALEFHGSASSYFLHVVVVS